MTEELAQTVYRAMQVNLGSQTRTWLNLPDGAGWIACVHVSELEWGNQSPQFFYPSLTQNNMRLLYECRLWRTGKVVLEPYTVLCFTPQLVVRPYCMFCRKFWDNNHMTSTRHRKEIDWWRWWGTAEAVWRALCWQPCYPVFWVADKL